MVRFTQQIPTKEDTMSDLIDKIAKLLNLAERASTQAERDAYMDKVQTLATTAQIDLEEARQRQADTTKREQPERRTVTLWNRYETVIRTRRSHVYDDNGYILRDDNGNYVFGEIEEYEERVTAKKPRHLPFLVGLFGSVATPNSLRYEIYQDSSAIVAYGFPSDLDVAETLFASLSSQMVNAADAALKNGEHKDIQDYTRTGHVDGRVFRASFYRGFAATINTRLKEARAAALAARDAERDLVVGTSSVDAQEAVQAAGSEVVLRNKEVEVSDFYKRTSNARGSYKGSSAGYNYGAIRRGRAAGARANLGTNKSLSHSKAVGR